MIVFLTWSGDRSKAVAGALRDCLKPICNAFQPWMSERDIALGAPWFPEILTQLRNAGAGVVCITPENQNERWLLFEAGALVRSVPEQRLAIPYLFGMQPGELRAPIREIQAAKSAADEGESWQLVLSLYGALQPAEKTLKDAELRDAFDMVWKARLKPMLDKIPTAAPAPQPVANPNAEMLALLRELVERDRERARGETESKLIDRLSARYVLDDERRRLSGLGGAKNIRELLDGVLGTQSAGPPPPPGMLPPDTKKG
jgi:hypothetical protein